MPLSDSTTGKEDGQHCICPEHTYTFTSHNANGDDMQVRSDYKVAFCKSPCRASGEDFSSDVYWWGMPKGREDTVNRRPRMRVRVIGRSKDDCHNLANEVMKLLQSRFAQE